MRAYRTSPTVAALPSVWRTGLRLAGVGAVLLACGSRQASSPPASDAADSEVSDSESGDTETPDTAPADTDGSDDTTAGDTTPDDTSPADTDTADTAEPDTLEDTAPADTPSDTALETDTTEWPCEPGSASTGFGVTIAIDLEDCAFTLAELAAGVAFPYTVVLEDNGAWVWSGPLDAGRCDAPGAGGLRLLERFAGGDESWCVCDTGLCFEPEPVLAQLVPGTYEGSVEWDGRNWFGPSDTGFEPGDPFPPGAYTFSVRAAGIWGNDATGDTAWDVTASVPVYVTE